MVSDIRSSIKDKKEEFNFIVVCGNERICFNFYSKGDAETRHSELAAVLMEYGL